ncbi:serine-threonine protein kinase, putative [Entamoeba invadens IP1]|uniref:serine-threonine protein kinase, putative n=1 Tax=Entamoeba invadens IP1 TaxID=370355 RepID=UPI0002C3D240|nr:serine-threonine protein kinase, putative [Entamoeba invadens IP1]ELP90596.1 serine-threonine protein kinase, putative [Entamoeba invadens IP1]|eukprot:XP_004257367.1 serine-threonine protein kinase, putative [Entamoeba invadens IP1]
MATTCWIESDNIIDYHTDDRIDPVYCNKGYGWKVAYQTTQDLFTFYGDCCRNEKDYYIVSHNNNFIDKLVEWKTSTTMMRKLIINVLYPSVKWTFNYAFVPSSFLLEINSTRESVGSTKEIEFIISSYSVYTAISGNDSIALTHKYNTYLQRPFVLIESLSGKQQVKDISEYNEGSSEIIYVFTGIGIDSVSIKSEKYDLFKACEYDEKARYVARSRNSTESVDCSCIFSGNEREVSTSSNFVFPDCKVYNRMFDLTVLETQNIIVFDDPNLYSWKSLVLNTKSCVEANVTFSGHFLIIFLEQVVIQNRSVVFQTDVSFESLFFSRNACKNQINVFSNLLANEIVCDNCSERVLFLSKNEVANTTRGIKKLCDTGVGFRYGTLDSLITCSCRFNISEYIENDCEYISGFDSNKIDLIVYTNSNYNTQKCVYFNSLTVQPNVLVSSQIRARVCDFYTSVSFLKEITCDIMTFHSAIVSVVDPLYSTSIQARGITSIFGIVYAQYVEVFEGSIFTLNSQKLLFNEVYGYTKDASNDLTLNSLVLQNESSLQIIGTMNVHILELKIHRNNKIASTSHIVFYNIIYDERNSPFSLECNNAEFMKGEVYLSRVIVEQKGILIHEDVSVFSMEECYTTLHDAVLLNIERGSSSLTIKQLPRLIDTDVLFLAKTNVRKINVEAFDAQFVCDRQLIVIGNVTETLETCTKFGVSEKTCVYIGNSVYYDLNNETDYSCPGGVSTSVVRELVIRSDTYTMSLDEDYTKISVPVDCNINITDKEIILSIGENLQRLVLLGNNTILQLTQERFHEYTVVNDMTESYILVGEDQGFGDGFESTFETSKYYYSALKNEFNVTRTGKYQGVVSMGDSVYAIGCRFYINGTCLEVEEQTKCVNYNIDGSCQSCDVGFFKTANGCVQCEELCERCIDNSSCAICTSNHIVGVVNEQTVCEVQDMNCQYSWSNRCLKCEPTTFFNGEFCDMCIEHCLLCTDKSSCLICDVSLGYSMIGGVCVYQKHSLFVVNNGTVECENGYYLRDKTCEPCDEGCRVCYLSLVGQMSECDICFEGYSITTDNKCKRSDGSLDLNNSRCVNTTLYFNGKLCVTCEEHCFVCTDDGICALCQDGYYLYYSDKSTRVTCKPTPQPHCAFSVKSRCITCESGYYVSFGICVKCSVACSECIDSSIRCLKCGPEYSFNNGDCVSLSVIFEECTGYYAQVGPNTLCSSCSIYYYLDNGVCTRCTPSCRVCEGVSHCVTCNEFNFVNETGECEARSDLTNCFKTDIEGCQECSKGYYLLGKRCQYCDVLDNHCQVCNVSSGRCERCETHGYVLSDTHDCTKVSQCIQTDGVTCLKCSTMFSVSADGKDCELQVTWILLIVFSILITLLGIFAVTTIFVLINKEKKGGEYQVLLEKFDEKEIRRKWHRLSSDKKFYINTKMIEVMNESECIPVDEDSHFEFVIANGYAKLVKIDIFSIKKKMEKYSITYTPSTFLLDGKKSIKINVKVHPYCSTTIEDSINIVTFEIYNSKQNVFKVPLYIQTQKTSKIDPDDIVEESLLGCGAFGVVMKGRYKNNSVAIKKIRDIFVLKENNELAKHIEEFGQELKILENLRHPNIVHYYGGVTLFEKWSIVLELAPLGSLRTFIEKKKKELNEKMKLKIMYDAAKGIEYLHMNNTLHRDIKPDNILIFSEEENEIVNAKLTDFGSARAISLYKTALTLTKQIGTLAFMAPEVYLGEKYGMEADVYSFGMTLCYIIKWNDPFDGMNFVGIPKFVADGGRPQLSGCIDMDVVCLINMCWEQERKNRPLISDVVSSLQSILYNNH